MSDCLLKEEIVEGIREIMKEIANSDDLRISVDGKVIYQRNKKEKNYEGFSSSGHAE